eukprot:GILK01008379.1.p1 GENE.GILK01008379.1~~GILK01008379.1.p1  ORF type:complete len:827 (-),score=160.51 GILK01008379.1:39-2462(-)
MAPAPLLAPVKTVEGVGVRDVDSEAVVSMRSLVELRCISGGWAVIRSDSSKVVRLVRLIGVADEQDAEGCIYLPPPLLHHYPSNRPLEVQRVHSTAAEERLPLGWQFGPVLADKVILSAISSPLQTSDLGSLQDHFKSPRCLTEGDVFGLPLHPLQAPNKTHTDNHYRTMTWFKVESIQSSTLPPSAATTAVSPAFDSRVFLLGHTTLIQQGTVQSYVPKQVDSVVSSLPSLAESQRRLESLVRSSLHSVASKLGVASSCLILGPRGSGKRSLVRCVTARLGIHLYEVNMFDLLTSNDKETEANVHNVFQRSLQYAPCVLHVRRFNGSNKYISLFGNTSSARSVAENRLANLFKDNMRSIAQASMDVARPFNVVFVASTESVSDVTSTLRGLFTHELVVETPDEAARQAALDSMLNQLSVRHDLPIQTLARSTAGRTWRDLQSMLTEAVEHANRSSNGPGEHETVLTKPDFEKAMESLTKGQSATVDAPQIPNVKWEDVGGLQDAKAEVYDTVTLPLEHPELFVNGLKQRSGLLFFGPPGTGKTLLAKAIATECSLNFISVKGPELLNMYIGESERNVREVFQKARNARPCVLFFDELDSLAPARGRGSDSGGVMDRVVSQLLTELDGIGKSADVFVIGATNRPDLLDNALLRPGRLDRLIYLGVSETKEAQYKVIQALTRKFRLAADVDLRALVETCPFNFTGADFYALASDALLDAISNKINDLEREADRQNNGNYYSSPVTARDLMAALSPEEQNVQVSMDNFISARKKLVPSISQEELHRYKQLQAQFTKQTAAGTSNSSSDR